MDKQIEKRWGIVALGVLMLLVVLVAGGNKSIYSVVWVVVSYYAYKGDLSAIKKIMKLVIFINLIALAFCLVFLDEESIGFMANGKDALLAGVLLMLIPKVILYFYVDDQLGKVKPSFKSSKLNVAKPHTPSSKILGETKPLSMEDAYASVTSSNKSVITQSQSIAPDVRKSMDENKLWEMAIDELDGENRKKGLWAKCFAEADGDENKAKANYLKQRVIDLKSEKSKDDLKVNNEKLSNIIQNNPNEKIASTISCPMCHTTNLRTRDDCVTCKYDLKSLKRTF